MVRELVHQQGPALVRAYPRQGQTGPSGRTGNGGGDRFPLPDGEEIREEARRRYWWADSDTVTIPCTACTTD